MNWNSSFYVGLVVAFFTLVTVQCTELTFELEDNARQCFYEDIKKDTKGTLEFQVSILFMLIVSIMISWKSREIKCVMFNLSHCPGFNSL